MFTFPFQHSIFPLSYSIVAFASTYVHMTTQSNAQRTMHLLTLLLCQIRMSSWRDARINQSESVTHAFVIVMAVIPIFHLPFKMEDNCMKTTSTAAMWHKPHDTMKIRRRETIATLLSLGQLASRAQVEANVLRRQSSKLCALNMNA